MTLREEFPLEAPRIRAGSRPCIPSCPHCRWGLTVGRSAILGVRSVARYGASRTLIVRIVPTASGRVNGSLPARNSPSCPR